MSAEKRDQKTSDPALTRIVYSARRRDGTYRWVEAVSWKDAKRYFGIEAVSIRKRRISIEDYHDSMFDGDSQADIYEIGRIRPEHHGLHRMKITENRCPPGKSLP